MRGLRRSFLFTPGNNPAMLLAGPIFGADALILDLEDAVAPGQKDAARILVAEALGKIPYGGVETVVRINPLSTPYGEDDLRAMLKAGPDTILLPKAEPRALAQASAMIQEAGAKTGILGLLETALGVETAFECGGIPVVTGLFFGAEDFTADIGARRSAEGLEILYARQRVVVAAAACAIDSIDTPFTGIDLGEDFFADLEVTKKLGFTGKACISPRHVEGINRALSPSAEEINYARRVLEADAEATRRGLGAVSLDGRMVDAPIVARARATLRRSGLDPGSASEPAPGPAWGQTPERASGPTPDREGERP